MSLLVSLLMGIVQGITEFLPISSSGHLTILENIFKLNYDEGSNLFFNVMLHFGTLIAIVIYYRKELKMMLSEIFSLLMGKNYDGRDENGRKLPKLRLTTLILAGTVPLLLVIPFRGYVEQLFDKLGVAAFGLLVTGLLLFFSDRIKPGETKEKSATLIDAVLIGFAQVVSVIPGLSRSGSTIVVGLARGFKRSFAVKFSFLLAVPAILGSFLFELGNAISAGIEWGLFWTYFAGMAVAAVMGYFAIGLVNLLVRKARMTKLAYYCWGLGGVSLIISLFI